MKKKLALLVISACILLLAGGCNTKDKLEGKSTELPPTPAVTDNTDAKDETDTTDNADAIEEIAPEVTPEVNEIVREEVKLEDYIKLGQYKDIEVTVEQLEVTQDDIDVKTQLSLQEGGAPLTEVTGRKVKIGDTVNIDYEGLKDGVAFEGGTAPGANLLIGSNSFIPGFEEKIVGANIGDKLDVDVTFPENYNNEELKGQPVVFKVTVNKIQEYEVTEEFVTTNTDYETVDAYKSSISDELSALSEENMKAQKATSVYNTVIENSEITSLPQNLLDYYERDLKVFYTNYAISYQVDLPTILSAFGMTEETFNVEAIAYADAMATRDLVLGAIIKAENLVLTDEEFNQQVDTYTEEYGYSSSEEFLANANQDLLKEDMLYQKAKDYIVAESIEL
ncbi:MAG TPA: trigger factor [Mobilitalea sp.]|nr:trigger factor [Mobilitalea sp.]